MVREPQHGGDREIDADQKEDRADDTRRSALDNVGVMRSRPLGAEPPDQHGRRRAVDDRVCAETDKRD
jgi:hypothetical protein